MNLCKDPKKIYIISSYDIIMSKRVTIMIEDELDKKIRSIQAKEIQSTSTSVSYSHTINKILKNNLKK
jgi:hypothetical protein